MFVSGGAAAPELRSRNHDNSDCVLDRADPVQIGIRPVSQPAWCNVTGVSFLINALGQSDWVCCTIWCRQPAYSVSRQSSNPSVEADTTEMKRAAKLLAGHSLSTKQAPMTRSMGFYELP